MSERAGQPEVLDVVGKVVVMRGKFGDADVQHSAFAFRDAGAALVVLLVNDELTIETLDEDQMRAAGWVRAHG